MHKSKTVFFLVILLFSAGLIYIKLDLINSNENALSKDSTDLVEFERKPSEEQSIKLSEMTELPRTESDDVTRTEETGKPKLDSVIDETNHQMAVESVGNTGDSLGAEIQLFNYLSDYAYGKNSYYLDKLNCTLYVCEVDILFFTQSDDMLKQISALMRDLPYKEAYVDNISQEGLSVKLIIHTDELK